jgi:hypothetical protein
VEQIYLPSDGPLVVRATRVVDSTKEDYRHLGNELSLVIDENSSASSALIAQYNVLDDDIRRTIAGRRLPKPGTNPESALHIGFMRGHFSGDNERKEFIELLSSELPVHDLEVSHQIEYGLKIVDPAKD